MSEEYKIFKVNYSYYQSLWGECASGHRNYTLVAKDEDEAYAKADGLFSKISKWHRRLAGGERRVEDNGEPEGYGILSNFKRKSSIITGYTIPEISVPTLSGPDAENFSLEAKVEGRKVTYVINPKSSD